MSEIIIYSIVCLAMSTPVVYILFFMKVKYPTKEKVDVGSWSFSKMDDKGRSRISIEGEDTGCSVVGITEEKFNRLKEIEKKILKESENEN